MWTIDYQRNGQDFRVSYDNEEISTTSSALEILIQLALKNPPVLYATPTGPVEEFNPSVSYLAYYLTAKLLFSQLNVQDWKATGDYEWPIEEEDPGTVFSYVDYLRKTPTTEFSTEFSNTCHDANGQFCETPGAPGHEDHRGKRSDDQEWEAAVDHKESLNATQKAALKWYGWAGSEYVNNHLRGTETPTKNNPTKNENAIKAIDKAFTTAAPLGGKTLYRGIYGSSKFATEILAHAKPGDTFSDKGYMSTTTTRDPSEFFTSRAMRVPFKPILVIKTKQDSRGLAVNEKEHELILPRGTSLRVTGPSTVDERGYTLIPVEVV